VPKDIVVEVAGDNGWPLREERFVFREGAPQRAELVFPAHTAAAVLRPYGQQIARDGSGHMDWRDMAQGRMERLGKPHRVAIEGKHREPLVTVVTDPHGIGSEANGTLPVCASARRTRR
jgi:hypothetical protein